MIRQERFFIMFFMVLGWQDVLSTFRLVGRCFTFCSNDYSITVWSDIVLLLYKQCLRFLYIWDVNGSNLQFRFVGYSDDDLVSCSVTHMLDSTTTTRKSCKFSKRGPFGFTVEVYLYIETCIARKATKNHFVKATRAHSSKS